MNKYEIAHRWCNCDFGRNGGFKGSNVQCNETYFYSYSTVYAMWLDKTPGNKLMVVMDDGGSVSSSSHLYAIKSAIPNDVKYIETSRRSEYYGWRNVNFNIYSWYTELPVNLLKKISESIEPFKNSKSVTTRENLKLIKRQSDDIRWLLNNRKDCKVKDIDKALGKDARLKKIFSFIRKNDSVEELIDHILGKGTYAAYDERLAPQKKAERTRKFVAWFNCTHNCTRKQFTKKEIDKMPIGEKVLRACMPPVEEWEKDNKDWHIINERDKRLAQYLLGNEKKVHVGIESYSDVVVNRFTGERYEFRTLYDDKNYWRLENDMKIFVRSTLYEKKYSVPRISLDEYKKLSNKDQWLKRFYQKCAIVSKRHNDLFLWVQVRLYTDEQLNQCSDSELEIFNRVQLKYAAFLADQEAQRLAREEEKRRLEEEKARLEEERRLKYQDYVQRGIEGYRALYYEKLDTISVARSFGSEFFFGGNVLLRWRTDELIETSKNILLTIKQAKKIFKQVQSWHDNQKSFYGCSLETQSGTYSANSYENDMLTAGCHQIAYCEMERMYNEILKKEAA